MPSYTNRHNLPAPLAALLGRESYSRGRSRISATQLIGPPKLAVLREAHAKDMTTDVADRVWALFGTAVHKLIEEGAVFAKEDAASEGRVYDIAEERVFSEVEGWLISGAIDRQLVGDGGVELIDWKVTGAISVLKDKPDWHNQLNLLAYLVEKEKGLKVSGLKIGALVRDWNRREALRDPAYPQAPVHMVDIPLWDYARREAYVLERVRAHQAASLAYEFGDPLPECSAEELWSRPDQWAVKKPENKRALKVFDTLAEAEALALADPRLVIEHRRGAAVRCGFCEAAPWCDQGQANLQAAAM